MVGVLLLFIFSQARWINRLLDRHEKAYSGEIKRMNKMMNRLLTCVLGDQPSSQGMPSIEALVSKPGRRDEPKPTDRTARDKEETR